MSYISGDYVQCERLQDMLDTNFLTCPTPQENIPSLLFILQTQFANGIAQKVADGTGKVRTVRLVYDQRLLESDVTEGSGARSCSTTNETFNDYTDYEIDPNVWLNASEKFDTANLATVCTEDIQSMLSKKIAKVMDAVERKIATKTATELVALKGGWADSVSVDGSSNLVVSTFIGSAANKVLDYTALSKIRVATMKTGYCAPMIIAGGSTLYEFGLNINAGCCSTTGVNLLDAANQFGHAFLYDQRLETALGDSGNRSLVMQAGSTALIYYNEAPQIAQLGANYAKMRMQSPRTGIWMDIVLQDDCGKISVNAYANTKLVGLPNDMFAVGDKFRGVKWVNGLQVTNS